MGYSEVNTVRVSTMAAGTCQYVHRWDMDLESNQSQLHFGRTHPSRRVLSQRTVCAKWSRGIMITETGVNQRHEKIVWIPKPKHVGDKDYFQEAIKFAEERKQSLKFRIGGGADLGVLQLTTDSASKKPFLVDLLGAPASWEGQDLTELLVSHHSEKNWIQKF